MGVGRGVTVGVTVCWSVIFSRMVREGLWVEVTLATWAVKSVSHLNAERPGTGWVLRAPGFGLGREGDLTELSVGGQGQVSRRSH